MPPGMRAIHVPEAGIVDFQGSLPYGWPTTSAGWRHDPRPRPASRPCSSAAAKCVVNHGRRRRGRLCRQLRRLALRPRDRDERHASRRRKIVPFRGEYFELKPEAAHLCRNLIYPVPDPAFPFLGVHFTRMVARRRRVRAERRAGFCPRGISQVGRERSRPGESLTYPGFLRMAAQYWKNGLGRDLAVDQQAGLREGAQRLVPEIRAEHLHPAPAGVRTRRCSRDGSLVDDFSIEETERVINVLNAPSPAATASLNIGRLIVDRLATRLD